MYMGHQALGPLCGYANAQGANSKSRQSGGSNIPCCTRSSLWIWEVLHPLAEISLEEEHAANALMEEVDATAYAGRPWDPAFLKHAHFQYSACTNLIVSRSLQRSCERSDVAEVSTVRKHWESILLGKRWLCLQDR